MQGGGAQQPAFDQSWFAGAPAHDAQPAGVMGGVYGGPVGFGGAAGPSGAAFGGPVGAPVSRGAGLPASASPFEAGAAGGLDDDETPLLEELGINLDHIRSKTVAVLHPLRPVSTHLMDDTDLAGPLVFALALGFFLLLTGKVHFGYIYGFGVVGCYLIFGILNLMCESSEGVDLHRVVSILGYCLLPIVLLAGVNVVVSMRGVAGLFLGLGSIAWCTVTATRFFERALDMRHQRYLVAYPLFLLYSCFALITVF